MEGVIAFDKQQNQKSAVDNAFMGMNWIEVLDILNDQMGMFTDML